MAGANGTLGIGRVARAAPDGYTLAFSVSFATHVVNGAIYALPYDVVGDFTPVALVADNPQLILAKKAMPARDLKDLIAWLKANPDKASLGKPARAARRMWPVSCFRSRPAPASNSRTIAASRRPCRS